MSTQSGKLRALCAHVDHRAGCGKCDICMAADQVEQLEIKNVELEKQVEMLQSGARSNIRLHADLSKVTNQRDRLLAALTEVRDDAIAGEGLVSNQSLVLMDSAIDGVKARIPTCTHPKAKTIHTGDGTTVEYCPDCGRNEAQPVRFQCDDTEGGA